MKNIKVFLLESNDEFRKNLREYFQTATSFELLGDTDDGMVGLEMIEQKMPDVIVSGMVLKNLDGVGVLEGIRSRRLGVKSIVTGHFIEDTIINQVLAKGASYYLLRPVSPETVAARILSLFGNDGNDNAAVALARELHDKRRMDSLDERISAIFISIGIPPHIKGYNYLREGIKMAVVKPAVINNVTKELYPGIAEKFETSASKVERAIRHAIEVAWNRGRVEAINSVFGVRVYIGNEKPTNSEFIALVADKLILDGFI